MVLAVLSVVLNHAKATPLERLVILNSTSFIEGDMESKCCDIEEPLDHKSANKIALEYNT